MVPSSILGDVEIMAGFLATSIATYRPLYRFVFKDPTTVRYVNSFRKETASHNIKCSGPRVGTDTQVNIESSSTSISSPSGNGIAVRKDIELSRYDGKWVRMPDYPEPCFGARH